MLLSRTHLNGTVRICLPSHKNVRSILQSVICYLSSVICNLFLQKTVDTHQIFVHNALVCFLSSENTHGRPSRYHRWQRPRQKRPGNPCAARAGPRSRLWRQHYYAPRKSQRPRTWWARAVRGAHSCFKRQNHLPQDRKVQQGGLRSRQRWQKNPHRQGERRAAQDGV